MAVATVAAPIVGGLVGNLMGAGDRKRQRNMLKAAMEELNAVGAPPDLSREIIFKELQRAGILTSELEEEIQIAESEVAKIKPDKASVEAMRRVADQYSNLSKTGFGAEDRAATNQVMSELGQNLRAARETGLQRAQATGQGQSGAALVAMLSGDQQAMNTAADNAAALSANMSSARRDALEKYGRMAGEMRNIEFNEAATRAQALDERNRMIAQNAMARQSSNVNTINQDKRFNLSEEQRLRDTNTQMANQEKLRQMNEKGNLWDRQLGLAQARSAAQLGQASQWGQQAQQTQQMYAGIGSGLGQAGQSIMGNEKMMNRLFGSSDENKKNNIDYSDEEVTLWMDRISKLLRNGKK